MAGRSGSCLWRALAARGQRVKKGDGVLESVEKGCIRRRRDGSTYWRRRQGMLVRCSLRPGQSSGGCPGISRAKQSR